MNANVRMKLTQTSLSMISNVLIRERRDLAYASLRIWREKATHARDTQSKLEQQNPYFDKYRDKIAKFKKENPALYIDKLDSLESEAKAKNPKIDSTRSTNEKGCDDVKVQKPSSSLEMPSAVEFSNLEQRTSGNAANCSLDTIMRLDKLIELPESEISSIWKNYHLDKNFVCAIICASNFFQYQKLLKKYPTFLLVLPKNEGFEFIYTQAQYSTLLFTKLSSYKLHKENAPVFLSLTYYTDLADSKGLVLMRGQYDPDVVSPMEAQTLVNQHQLFYNESKDNKLNTERLKLVQLFNEHPDEFDYNDLLNSIPGYEKN